MLHQGDCLEVMRTLPDKSIDLFLCDLPYGCFEPKRKRDPKYVEKVKGSLVGQARCAWDIKIDLPAFWTEVKRLAKDDHTPVIHFCNSKFGFDLYNSNPDWFRYDLVWNKQRGVSFLQANKMPMRSHENIYVFAKKSAKYYRKDEVVEGKTAYKKNDERRCVLSVIDLYKCPSTKNKHPTQKPLDLYTFLIERYSKEGDTILDPTFGSGNSGFAAKQLNRNYIGIEKDPTFFQTFSSKFANI
jgi:site-specific DNA-methyltransferase (adenine-specific)